MRIIPSFQMASFIKLSSIIHMTMEQHLHVNHEQEFNVNSTTIIIIDNVLSACWNGAVKTDRQGFIHLLALLFLLGCLWC